MTTDNTTTVVATPVPTSVEQLAVAPKTSSRNVYNITPENFVRVWAESKNTNEVVEKLSVIAGKPVQKSAILARASSYRKAGIELHDMERVGKKRIDVAALNAVTAKIEQEQTKSATVS